MRLVGRSSQEVQNAADDILRTRRDYSDTSVDIMPTPAIPRTTPSPPILHYDENDGYNSGPGAAQQPHHRTVSGRISTRTKEYHNIKKRISA